MRTNNSLYTICFATILASLCGLLTAGAKEILAPWQARHVDAERARAVLEVLGIKAPADTAELAGVYNRFVIAEKIGDMHIYERIVPHAQMQGKPQIVAWAIPFSGRGYINKMEGLVSIDAKTSLIQDVVFTELRETPNYGMKINQPEFRARFRGKDPFDAIGRRRGIFLVKPGQAKEQNEIDAIAGATETSKALQNILNSALDQFDKTMEAEPGRRESPRTRAWRGGRQ